MENRRVFVGIMTICISVVLVIVVVFNGFSGVAAESSTNNAVTNDNSVFATLYDGDDYDVVYDKNTGVCYYLRPANHNLVPVLDEDGTAVTKNEYTRRMLKHGND